MTDEEYIALLDQAAAAYRERNKWVRPEDLAGWYGAAASTDEAGKVTGRGIVIQGSRPEDFGTFMTSWMKWKTAPPLRWRATRFGNEPPAYPDRDGVLIDDGFSVGRVRYDPVAFSRELPEWVWHMQARGKTRPKFATEGRSSTKAEAKAAVEQAYAALCENPVDRQAFMEMAKASKEAADAWSARHGRAAGGPPKR